jgi:hypothetical protein
VSSSAEVAAPPSPVEPAVPAELPAMVMMSLFEAVSSWMRLFEESAM